MDSFTPIVFRFFLVTSLLPATTSLPDFSRARRSDLLLDAMRSNEEPPQYQGSLSENHGEDLLVSLKQIRSTLGMVRNLQKMLEAAARKNIDSTKRFGPRNRFLRVGRTRNPQNPAKGPDENVESKYYSELRRNLDILKTLALMRHSDASSSLDEGDAFQRMARIDNDGESDHERNEFLQIDERNGPKNKFLRIGRAQFLRLGERPGPNNTFSRESRAQFLRLDERPRPYNTFLRISRAPMRNFFVRIGRRPQRNHFIRIGKRAVRSVSNSEEEEEEEEDSRKNNNDESEDQDKYGPQLTFEREARNGEEMDEEDEDRERYLQQLLQLQRRSGFVRIGRLPASVYIQRRRMFSGRNGRPQSLENLSQRRSPGFRLTDAGIVRAGKRSSDLD